MHLKSTRPAFIVNASSGLGGKDSDVSLLEEILERYGIDSHVTLVQSGPETIAATQQAIRENCDPIIAGGGDGTINAVASQLIKTERVLGLLPLGTFNHFAKDVGIPIELESAVKTILEGHVIQVDVGEVNGRIFLNNSSIGLYPYVVHHREKQQRHFGRGKWTAFVWAALSVLKRYPFVTARLHFKNQDIIRRAPFIFIGNNRYEMGHFDLGKRSRLDAGELSVYIAHRTGRLGLFMLALKGLFVGLSNQEDFDALSTREVRIETHRRTLRVATDGEVGIATTPLNYRILPRALRVIASRKSEDEQMTS